MAHQKAAIQMSLGFIVAVVFAVILLSLAVVWLQDLMGGISGISDDLTKQAQNVLKETFSKGESNFMVWPNDYNLDRGDTLKTLAGIKNNAADGKSHTFYIKVFSMNADATSWIRADVPTTGQLIQIGEDAMVPVFVEVPRNATLGTYSFYVVACTPDNIPGNDPRIEYINCDMNHLNWGGSAQPLTITLES